MQTSTTPNSAKQSTSIESILLCLLFVIGLFGMIYLYQATTSTMENDIEQQLVTVDNGEMHKVLEAKP